MLAYIIFISYLHISFSNVVWDSTDNCSIYPSCEQYGEGSWQILEDCHKYIVCERVNGELRQTNMVCEKEDQIFAKEYGTCVSRDLDTECKSFQDTTCFAVCPRVMLVSQAEGQEFQSRRLGCFRLAGTLFGGSMAFFQNMHHQYLTPDATSNPTYIHWLVTEQPGGFNGGVRNREYDYIRCPFDGWTGWEVDTGLGNWVVDNTMVAKCYHGDDHFGTTTTTPVVPTTTAPVATTTTDNKATTTKKTATTKTTTTSTTMPPDGEPCTFVGPNPVPGAGCVKNFYCCVKNNGVWSHKACTCEEGRLFHPDFYFCSKNCDVMEYLGFSRADHTCDDGQTCHTFQNS